MDGEVLRDDQWERLKPFVPVVVKVQARMSAWKLVLRRDTRGLPCLIRARCGYCRKTVSAISDCQRCHYRWIEQAGIFDRLDFQQFFCRSGHGVYPRHGDQAGPPPAGEKGESATGSRPLPRWIWQQNPCVVDALGLPAFPTRPSWTKRHGTGLRPVQLCRQTGAADRAYDAG